MINNTNLGEDTNNIKLIDKHRQQLNEPDKQENSSKCCSYLLECLFIICC
jgi:hypothetical protein